MPTRHKRFRSAPRKRVVRACSFLFCFINSYLALAQPDNRPLEQRFPFDSLPTLSFRFYSLAFVRNNEYFNPVADGYTLWGYQLAPRLAYRPAPDVLLEGGLFLQKDFGRDRLSRLAPTFTVKFRRQNWNFLFGTLEGSVGHRLIEPLYHFERLLRNRLENGLQINHRTDRTFFDFWIDYPQHTGPGSRRQEQFWGGISSEITLNRPRSGTPRLRFTLPLQLTVFHAGGQNILSPLPVRTGLNAAGSLSLTYHHGEERFLQSLRLDTYALIYRETAATNRSGGGFYPNLTLTTKPLTLLLSYWNGNYFHSEFGGDLYQSYSRRFNDNTVEARRRLLFLRLSKTMTLAEGILLTLRFEPHYDAENGLFEHSEAIYITIDPEAFGL